MWLKLLCLCTVCFQRAFILADTPTAHELQRRGGAAAAAAAVLFANSLSPLLLLTPSGKQIPIKSVFSRSRRNDWNCAHVGEDEGGACECSPVWCERRQLCKDRLVCSCVKASPEGKTNIHGITVVVQDRTEYWSWLQITQRHFILFFFFTLSFLLQRAPVLLFVSSSPLPSVICPCLFYLVSTCKYTHMHTYL